MENANLRSAVEDLTITFEEFQSKMTKSVLEQQQQEQQKQQQVGIPDTVEDKYSSLFSSDTSVHMDSMSCLEQARYVEKRLDATSALLAEAVNGTSSRGSNGSTPKSVRKSARFSTPLRDSSLHHSTASSRRAGAGTPAARPLNWLVQQANSEVKVLRARAEKLQWNIPDESEGTGDKENLSSNESTLSPARQEVDAVVKKSSNSDPNAQVLTLQRQLEESLSVIYEMDRLVHAALVGNLSSGVGGRSSLGGALDYREEDEEEDEGSEDYGAEFDLTHKGTMTPGHKKMRGSFDPSEWSLGDLLPSGETCLCTYKIFCNIL